MLTYIVLNVSIACILIDKIYCCSSLVTSTENFLHLGNSFDKKQKEQTKKRVELPDQQSKTCNKQKSYVPI